MDLRELLLDIADAWDRHAGQSSRAQLLLRGAPSHLEPYIPAGYIVEGSGGRGVATLTPWIAVFNPDETNSAQRGMYVVYLFAEDMSAVTLSLNHGVTDFVKDCRLRGESRTVARRRLRELATTIRKSLPSGAQSDLQPDLDLHSRGDLQRDYVDGHVLGVEYALNALPQEARLRHDLHRMLMLYDIALSVREQGGIKVPGQSIPKTQSTIYNLDPAILNFDPKSDGVYDSYLPERRLLKSRRHETLVKEFGAWAKQQGLEVGTNVHPVDALLRSHERQWIVEAEFVYGGNVSRAFREAIGQLIDYQYRHYRHPTLRTHRLAVFSESIGPLYTEMLDSESTASVWKSLDGYWAGSPLAISQGLPVGRAAK